MAKQEDDQDTQQQISEAMEAFEVAMAGLGLTPTEEELAAKRLEVTRRIGGTELAIPGAASAESWDDVQRIMEQSPESVAVLRDFVKLDLKEQLVNVPFMITSLWFATGDQGEYVTLKVVASRDIMTPTGATQKLVLTDGSTGIFQQLRKLVLDTGQTENILVRNGLRVSRYTVDTDEGTKDAETFYLQ